MNSFQESEDNLKFVYEVNNLCNGLRIDTIAVVSDRSFGLLITESFLLRILAWYGTCVL